MQHQFFVKHCFMYLISSSHNNPEKWIDSMIAILQMRKPRPETLGDFPKVTPLTSSHATQKPILWLEVGLSTSGCREMLLLIGLFFSR